ncbi:MAG: CBS domain-containing protein [Chloroflexi bacterium]|nr:CBS domain-containing protein [Chloroflexota bacterium]
MKFHRAQFGTFVVTMVAYLILAAGLLGLAHLKWITFSNTTIGNMEDFFISLPAIAFYLLVALAALAGWARGVAMFSELGLGSAIKSSLKKKKLSTTTVQSQLRGGAYSTVTADTTLKDALHDILTVRIPILPVVAEGKVSGVITLHDIAKKLDEQMRAPQAAGLAQVGELKMADLKPAGPVTSVRPDDTLAKVLQEMLSVRRTKVVVTDAAGALVGTLDLFDLVDEMLTDVTAADPGAA